SLYCKYIFWDGGWGYGPRYLLDVVAILCLFLVAPLARIWSRPALRAAFLALGLVSVGVNALGAYFYDPLWEGQAPTMEENYKRIARWRDSQILWHLRRTAGMLNAFRIEWSAAYNSANAPDQRGGRYEADLSPRTVRAGEALFVPFYATNTGRAAWLHKPPRYYGAVRLGWSWGRGGREGPP